MRAAFHGRTSVAVAVTDNPAIQAPLNRCHEVTFIGLNDRKALESELETGAYAAVIVEGIQLSLIHILYRPAKIRSHSVRIASYRS